MYREMGSRIDESTQKTYCGIIRREFFDEEEDIEVIVERVTGKVRALKRCLREVQKFRTSIKH